MIQDELINTGLTRSESAAYAALLRLGTARTGAILVESKLNSGKIYEILESLKNKGLVSESTVNGVRQFTASPPAQLLSYVEQQEAELRVRKASLQRALPALDALRQSTKPKKTVLTYTGFRGIVTAAEELLALLDHREEILSLGISDVNAWSQDYWVRWEKLRQRKQVSARYILSEQGSIYKDLAKEKNLQLRVLLADTPVGIDVYGTKAVLLLHYQDPVSCTIIYDEHTVQTFRSYFELLWRQAQKPRKR